MGTNGIDFSRTFGAQNNNQASNSSNGSNNADRSQQSKAKIWLNIGYLVTDVPVTGAEANQTEDRFVSLPVGIPLDTMEKLPTNSRNASYAQFQAARNDLYDQLMEAAEKLAPGEDIVMGIDGGLAVQIRRVQDERENVVATDDNPFVAKLQINI
mgnify:CR=1 FL=1